MFDLWRIREDPPSLMKHPTDRLMRVYCVPTDRAPGYYFIEAYSRTRARELGLISRTALFHQIRRATFEEECAYYQARVDAHWK